MQEKLPAVETATKAADDLRKSRRPMLMLASLSYKEAQRSPSAGSVNDPALEEAVLYPSGRCGDDAALRPSLVSPFDLPAR
jgi:hypothetical protein